MHNKTPVEIDGTTGEVGAIPTPKGVRYRAKLDTLSDVKREIARVYREARSGVTETQDATKQVWMLQALGKVIETSDLEERVKQLEDSK